MASTQEHGTESSSRNAAPQVRKAETAAPRAAGEMRDFGNREMDAADVTKAAAKSIREGMDQQGETVAKGVNAMAEAAAPIAQSSREQEQRFVTTTAKVAGTYSEAADDTFDDVQALTVAYSQLGLGMMRMQRAYLGALQQSVTSAKRHPHELLRCKSVTEFAEMQRDLYKDGLAFMLDSSMEMLRLAGEIVQGASRPLEQRGPAGRENP